jgi:hypothetical protein
VAAVRVDVAIALVALIGCADQRSDSAESTGSAASIAAADAARISAVARKLSERAAADEPAISARVRALATEAGGRLSGFEHRLKTIASLERKIRTRVRANPELTFERPDIVDALRYTVVIDAAAYVAAVRTILERLEADGHRVVRVKNYWPPGDNYSGVNTVFARGELQWELQFHTPESVEVRDAWHPAYEQLREPDTPIDERRWLYQLMAVPWDLVAIPDGLDRAGALHPRDQIRRYPPP